MKTLLTPNLVQNDEPNQVSLDIYPDGNIKMMINDTPFITKLDDIDTIKYMSFASDNNIRTEYFYNCATSAPAEDWYSYFLLFENSWHIKRSERKNSCS